MVEICACADISNIKKLGSDIFVDINKIQTDFPRSEVFLRSVMHNHSPSFNDFCNNYQRRYQMRLKANKYHIL